LSLRRKPVETGGANLLVTLYNGDCGVWIAKANPARVGLFVRAKVGSKSGWVKSKWLKRSADLEMNPGLSDAPTISSSGLDPGFQKRLDDHSARYGKALDELSTFARSAFVSGTASSITFYCDPDYSASRSDAWFRYWAYKLLKATAPRDETERRFISLCQTAIDVLSEDIVSK
jgi:hypothetical protein